VKYLKKFNESKDYYEEIPEDDFWESQYLGSSSMSDVTLPFTNREIEMIKSICDEVDTELKAPKVIDLNNEVYELELINLEGRSLIYKIEDEYFLFGFNVDTYSGQGSPFRESSSTFYKVDQIDGLIKLLNDKL
jgi:hypothetical protein